MGAPTTDADVGADTPAPQRSAWPFVLVVALTARLVQSLAGTLLVGVVPPEPFYRQNPPDVPFGSLTLWAHWDGVHFLSVAQGGYDTGSPAFFPLYPLLVRGVGELLGGPITPAGLGVAAVVVSTAVLPLGLWFLHRLAAELGGDRVARTAVLLVAFFPTSFFLGAAYSEALFLTLSVGALWAARVRGGLALACGLAALAAATRNVGVVLVLPLAVEWWHHRGRPGWHGGWLALAPGGLVAYVAYLGAARGDPLAFVHEQAKWGRSLTGATDATARALAGAGHSVAVLADPASYRPFAPSRLVLTASGLEPLDNVVFFLVAVVVTVLAARVLPWHLTAYAGVLVVVSGAFGTGSDPLMAVPRYVLVAFPLFVAAAMYLRDRRVVAAVVGAGVVTSVPLIALFVNWYFVA